jgi:hypothetical protein
LRTTTLGLSDFAIAQAATGDREEGAAGLAGIKEAAPVASVAGEVAGAINPFNPLNKAAAGITGAARGMSLLGRAGVGAAVGMGEGVVYGGGKALSDAVLDGGPLTGERLATEIGSGALWGGLAGGGLPVVGAGLGSLGKRLLGAVDAPKQALKAIGAKGMEFRRLGTKADDVGELLLGYTMREGDQAGQPLMQALRSSDDLVGGVQQMKRELAADL